MRRVPRNTLWMACLLSLLFAYSSYGLAQDPITPATKEPVRFAYIVGNGRYQRSMSNLDDLTDACDEVVNFRKELLSLGWQEDHIFPLVKHTEGDEEGDDVAAGICDLKNADLTLGLTAFVDMLMANQNNPYGVVYYAGHGAQSNEEFYAFGVDANVDLAAEIGLVDQYPNYEIFSRASSPDQSGTTAVNLTRIVSQMNGPTGKALLMILNACRNDPVLDDFLENRQIPGTLDSEKRRRLSLGYINTKPDKYDRMYQNIMVMFSGRPQKAANGGTTAKPNWFSQELLRYMQDTAHQEVPTPVFVSDFETASKKDQLSLPDYSRQIPSHIGSMARAPAFCLRGCAQVLSVWVNEKIEIISESRIPEAKHNLPTSAHNKIVRPWKQPRLLSTSFTQTAPIVPQPEFINGNVDATPRRRINLDVFYCSGDPSVASQQEAARQFAEGTRQGSPLAETVSGTYIGQIRLRSLDVNANLALDRPKIGTSLVLEKSDPASTAWATRLGTGFGRVYKDDVVKGFIRAYFCEGFSPKQKPRPLVYTQVAQKDQVALADHFLSHLSQGLPNLRFIQKIEPVDEGRPGMTHVPNATQIRYFTKQQHADAEAIATLLRQDVSKTVSVVEIKTAGPQVKRNPVIEIWFGREELAQWPSASK